MAPSRYVRLGSGLFLLASLAGLATALYLFFVPLTGVTGTSGALIVIASSAALVVAAAVIPIMPGRSLRNLLRILAVLGIAGTFTAAVFLHGWILVVAMIVALAGTLIDAGTGQQSRDTQHPEVLA